MLIGFVPVLTGLGEVAMLAGREQSERKMVAIETMIRDCSVSFRTVHNHAPLVQRTETGVSILVFDQSAIHCAL